VERPRLLALLPRVGGAIVIQITVRRYRSPVGQPHHWQREPALVGFYQYLISDGRLGNSHANTYCRNLLAIMQKTGMDLNALSRCDYEAVISRHYSDLKPHSQSIKRSAIRRFQESLNYSESPKGCEVTA